MLAAELVDSLGGRNVALEMLGEVATPPNFPELTGGISVGGDDAVEVVDDHATVWLAIQNTRREFPELNRVREIKLDCSAGHWLVRSNPTAMRFRDAESGGG